MIMKNNLLPVEVAQIAEKVSIEKRNEVQTVLNQVFDGVSKMREQLDNVNVVNENDKVNMKLANTIRLGVRQVRLDAEKTFDKKRYEVQQQMLSYKTEDQLWLKAKQTMQILTKEIEETARWKEETKYRFDAEQKELKVQQRILKIQKYAPEMLRSEFEYMSDETFDIFFSGIEKAYNDRIEAEKKQKLRNAKESGLKIKG
jgi:putative lipase involved disintegration of autophagic bodies